MPITVSPFFPARKAATLVLMSGCALSLSLGGCKTLPGGDRPPAATTAPQASSQTSAPVKATLLVPLSGKHAGIGGAMQNAAQLALFDLGEPNFELTFKDTGSTPAGSARAAKEAVAEGSHLILGPIFADEVRAARGALQGSKVNLISFSTDTSVAGPGSYMMGILPQDQAREAAIFTAQRGATHVLIVAGRDSYGRIMANSFTLEAQRVGLQVLGTLDPDEKSAPLESRLSPYLNASEGPAINAIFIPLTTERAAPVMAALNRLGAPRNLMRIGTGLWDEGQNSTSPEMVGAFYPAPSPDSRRRFETQYQATYRQKPPRLASLAYDATALAITMTKSADGPQGLTTERLTGNGGFVGIDGLFRLRPEGITQRELAILQIQAGRRVVVRPAETRFED